MVAYEFICDSGLVLCLCLMNYQEQYALIYWNTDSKANNFCRCNAAKLLAQQIIDTNIHTRQINWTN